MELIAPIIAVIVIGIWSFHLYGRHTALMDLAERSHLNELTTALKEMKSQLQQNESPKIPLHCSSKGVAISYAITQTGDKLRFLHHLSISRKTGRFHPRNAAFLGAYLIQSLQVDSWLKQMSTQNSRVMHLAFTINAEDQKVFMDKLVLSDPPDMKLILDECKEIKIKKLSA